MREPVLPPVAVLVARCAPRRAEPVGALVARHFAEAGARGPQALVERGAAHAARALRLAERPVHGVEETQGLDGTVAQIAAVPLEGRTAADVDVPEVERRVAVDDPVRQHLAGAARG